MLPAVLLEVAALGFYVGAADYRLRPWAAYRLQVFLGPAQYGLQATCFKNNDVVMVQGCHTSVAAPEHRQRPAELFS